MEVCQKHFEWQLIVDSTRLKIDNDHVIESHYCQPGAKSITINFNGLGKVHIDFDKLQTQNGAVKVQRLSFLSPGQSEDVGWYFRDEQLWREYGAQSNSSSSSSSVSSKDVELQFTQNPQGSFSFTVGSTTYNLDFSSMTQTNCLTGMSRGVRRRPKFNSVSLSSVTTPQDPNVFLGGWKWEFMGQEGVWTEYQSQVCGFGSDDIESRFQQNPQDQLQFRINRFSYKLDLNYMFQINNETRVRRAVRRTATSRGQQQQHSPNASSPRWQFLDMDGSWKDYGTVTGRHHSNVFSSDIELQYQQNPSGFMSFSTNRFSYELSFSAMTQRNLSTNTTRLVRRLNN